MFGMARPLRIEYPGAVYHVMSRGDKRNAIFVTDKDRIAFTRILVESQKRFNVLIHSYCLMTNHYHLLIETPDGNLSDAMHYINGVYTTRFNAANKTTGHVFQGRYKAILVERDEYLLCLCRYIVLNPIRAGLVEHPTEYAWSSFSEIAGIGKSHTQITQTDWILSQFAGIKKLARARYHEFVLSPDADRDKPFKKVVGGCFLGSDSFVSRFSDILWETDEIPEISRRNRYVNRPPLSALLPSGLSLVERNIKAWEAVYDFGYKQKEIADHLGLHYAYVSQVIAQEEES